MIIAFDFDDVLCNHTNTKLRLLRAMGYSAHRDQLTSDALKKCMGRIAYHRFAQLLYTSATADSPPSPGVKRILSMLRRCGHRLIIITKRSAKESKYLRAWLRAHRVEGFFAKVIYTTYKEKTPFLKTHRVDMFIENSWKKLARAPKGVIKILYNPLHMRIPQSFPHHEIKGLTEIARILTCMGNEVEPRKRFIHTHAKAVKNLDI